MKVLFKKFLSAFLTLSMLIALMPVIPASAAAISKPSEIPDDFHGYYLVYSETTLTDAQQGTTKKAAVVSWYAYNLDDYVMSLNVRFKYDPTKVIPANKNNGRATTVTNANFGAVANITDSMLDYDADNNGDLSGPVVIAGTESSPFQYVNRNDESSAYGKEEGYFLFDYMTANKNGTYENNGIGVKLPQGEAIKLMDMYFVGRPTNSSDVKTTTDIPDDLDRSFFDVYHEDTTYPMGYLAETWEAPVNGVLSNAATSPIQFLNFPAAAEPKASVTITAYPTRGDSMSETPNHKAGMTVELKNGEDVIGTYTTGAQGQLLSGGSAVGALKLAAGTYTWTVTPTDGVPNSGTFTITEEQASGSAAVAVKAYALGSGEASEQYYDMTVTDQDMSGKPVADNTQVRVTIDGEEQVCVVNSGKISVKTLPNSSAKEITVKAEGYKDHTMSVTFDAARAAVVANIALEQVRTKIELNVPVTGDDPVYVVIDKRPGGTVTDSMAMELPKTVQAGADGKVIIELPDGDYTYTIQTPGTEDVEMNLDVDNTGLQNGGTVTDKVTITDPEDPTKKTEIDASGDTATANKGQTVTGDQSADDATAELPAIEDRLYSVVGEWTETGMDVKVYLMNTSASTGTFGMTFDPSVFKTNDITVNLVGIEAIKPTAGGDLMLGSTALENPINANGKYLLAWRAKDNVPVDASAGKVEIANFKLEYADGVTRENVESKVSDTTLDSLAFTASAWYNTITAHFGSDAKAMKEFVSKYWRATDDENTAPITDANRLEEEKALNGGFYQTYSSIDAGDSLAAAQDTRQQFVFNTFGGAQKLQFVVTDPSGNPIEGATVIVTDETGKQIGTGITGADGKTGVPIPGDVDVKYTVSADGYKTSDEKTVPVANQETEQEVTLIPEMSHPVEIHPDQTSKVQLIGGDAYNGADYLFTLDEQPGYTWPNGMPAGSDLEIKLVTDTVDFDASTTTFTATWDGNQNKYVIAGNTINATEGKLVIKISDPTKVPVVETDPDEAYTVTVTSGEHGKFSYNADGNGSTFNPSTGTTDLTGTVVETLTVGTGTTSAKYSFKGDGPIDTANETLKNESKPYQAWVIYSMSVNGTEVPLTDKEKIDGVVDYQIKGIDRNQVINVTYGEATVEGDVIIDDPKPDPASKANVTVILSDYGSAQVNSDGAWDGANTKNYSMDPGMFTAVFTGKQNVAQPAGSNPASVSYEVDSVTVNGTQVNVAGNSMWTAGADTTSGTLAFTANGGENYTVVVTFKPVGKDPIFAKLEVVNRTGHGGTVPTGTTIQNVGLPVNVDIEPDSGWKIDVIDLTEVGGTLTDVTPDTTEVPGYDPTAAYTYTTPNLKAGVTVVGVSFKKDATYYFVQMDVKYAIVSNTGMPTAATITFTDTADGSQIVYGPEQLGAYQLQRPTGVNEQYKLEIPAGTYNVTVAKKGYLTYSVNGFTITDGTPPTAGSGSVSAEVKTNVGTDSETIIYFGQKDGEADTARRAVAIDLGDATWDGNLVALDDIAQVANGLQANPSAGQKKRADLDESGTVAVADMGYVIQNYGKRSTSKSYVDFMS